ncbi:MAG: exodeoxyribonuclease VII small subunit [Prevotellaceae bacterium]|jgi:exonuclease VII small subunit|nr:exodeoxyribonuclease VII small subunit [Prevotellaceae bacterium]MBF1062896.1 exodeoxyribonuclease VII small subunit [Prevotellaceae bacterium]MBF1073280.1 exodeoxyribonuclease VII small subunit [Prevotellaceae bacterium]MBF1079516.1 exodeoxyribonuclease VII small subunit [Prevotellaceae bacterium]
MIKENIKYEEAVQQLENIVQKLENGELNIDELSNELKKAQKLISLCRQRLTKTDEEIQKILNDK